MERDVFAISLLIKKKKGYNARIIFFAYLSLLIVHFTFVKLKIINICTIFEIIIMNPIRQNIQEIYVC